METQKRIRACDRYNVTAQWDAGEKPAEEPCKVTVVHYTAETPHVDPNLGWMACEGTVYEFTATHGAYIQMVTQAFKEAGTPKNGPPRSEHQAEAGKRAMAKLMLDSEFPRQVHPAFQEAA